MVERPLMVQWGVGSIPNGGQIEPFLVPASAPLLGVIKAEICAILSVSCAYKKQLLLI